MRSPTSGAGSELAARAGGALREASCATCAWAAAGACGVASGPTGSNCIRISEASQLALDSATVAAAAEEGSGTGSLTEDARTEDARRLESTAASGMGGGGVLSSARGGGAGGTGGIGAAGSLPTVADAAESVSGGSDPSESLSMGGMVGGGGGRAALPDTSTDDDRGDSSNCMMAAARSRLWRLPWQEFARRREGADTIRVKRRECSLYSTTTNANCSDNCAPTRQHSRVPSPLAAAHARRPP